MSKNLLAPIMCSAILLASACGEDSGSADGDVDAFCDMLRESETGEQIDLDEDFEAGMAELQRFRDAAPGEIRGDLDKMVEVFEQINDLEQSGADEEEMFGAVFALMFDPRFTEAAENLETFGVEECGLEPSADDGDDGGVFGGDDGGSIVIDGVDDGSGGEEPVPDGFITEEADVEDPLWDGPPFDDPIDPSEASYQGAQYFLDTNYGSAPWRTRLGSWASGGFAGSYSMTVGGLDVTADEAAEICAALAEYLAPLEPDATIEIESYTQDDDGFFNPGEVILAGTAADGC